MLFAFQQWLVSVLFCLLGTYPCHGLRQHPLRLFVHRSSTTRTCVASSGCPDNDEFALPVAPTSSKSKVPPPPPLSLPVWSLAAHCPTDNTNPDDDTSGTAPSKTWKTSMNIVTFAIPVSVAAPKLWVVSLYHDTLTKDSFCKAGFGVLQLLTPEHKHLVSVLGKHSGYDADYSKPDECSKLGWTWVETNNEWAGRYLADHMESLITPPLELLPRCASYVYVKHTGSAMEAGDHLAVLCEVIATGTWDADLNSVVNTDVQFPAAALDHKSALYSGQLREEGII